VVVLGYATAAVVMATAVTGPVSGSTYTNAHTPQDERCMRARPCTLPPAFPHDNTSRPVNANVNVFSLGLSTTSLVLYATEEQQVYSRGTYQLWRAALSARCVHGPLGPQGWRARRR
jgi:hypothetical protein